MKYCSNCGSYTSLQIPAGDTLPRHVCQRCKTIHYQNPKIVVGCIPEWQGQILLCKRAIEPRYGLWTIPAGFMENGETASEAASRETWEEAVTKVDISDLFVVFNLPQINQVYMMFLASLSTPDFSPGNESLECKLLDENEIPWPNLAFPTITHTLKFYFKDRAEGVFKFRSADIVREKGESVLFHRRSITEVST